MNENREAVLVARRLEDKAIRCFTIAQRMIPGATDEMTDNLAVELMPIPERGINRIIEIQERFSISLNYQKGLKEVAPDQINKVILKSRFDLAKESV